MRKALLAATMVLQLSAGMAFAGQYEEGVSAYKRNDYVTARKKFMPLAKQGLSDAQVNLGRMYEHGQGVSKDYAEAVKWYRLAAKQGYAIAQSNLGVSYAQGKGVTQDLAEAAKWQRLAMTPIFSSATGMKSN